MRAEVTELMKHFVPEYEAMVKARAVALPYLRQAHDRVWATPLKLHRFLSRTRYDA